VQGHDIRFLDRVFRLLERVEYRRAETLADKQEIYRLRHAAYTRSGAVTLGPSGMFHDADDETHNAWLVGVFIDDELASSVRLHVSASPAAPLPVVKAFPDEVMPLLRAGRTVIDGTRFVSELGFSQRHSELPFLTLRATFMASEFFDADYITVACQVEHQAFYRRMFGGVPWSGLQPYPLFHRPLVLIGHDRSSKAFAFERCPFFASTALEREAVFKRSSNAAGDMFEKIGRTAEIEATG
jgi:hypothetical protein